VACTKSQWSRHLGPKPGDKSFGRGIYSRAESPGTSAVTGPCPEVLAPGPAARFEAAKQSLTISPLSGMSLK